MSLDFYLKNPEKVKHTCMYCNSEYEKEEELYSRNITHNLTEMADKAWIYRALWHPKDLWVIQAKELINALEVWLKKLKDNPEFYEKFNADNWWWLYENFVPFVESVLNACKQYPEAIVETST